jgi:hypothetical protein
MTEPEPTATPVISTLLESVRYDASQSDLYLRFRDGKQYIYSQVPPAIYEDLLAAESKGAYFNHCIRSSFPFVQIQPAQA